jgi:hypothetical protein
LKEIRRCLDLLIESEKGKESGRAKNGKECGDSRRGHLLPSYLYSAGDHSLSLSVSVSVWMERKAGKRNESLNLNFLFVFVSLCSWFVLVFFLSYSELFELSLVK